MYFVKYGKEYLHDPRVNGFTLLDLSLQGEENSCGYCDFTMYPDHPMYDKIKERDADNPIEVYDDDILLFSGFIYELGKEFYLNGTVKCKGELDYLNESIVRPYSTLQRGYGDKAPDSVNKYFSWLIEKHNEQVGLNKQFVVGINQAASLDENNYIFRENNNYPTTIDEISEKLLKNENIGGYLSVRHENDIRYIDYYAERDKTNAQILDFGVNLTDYTQTDDSVDIATFIIPLGAKMSETEYSYNDGYSATTDTSVDESKIYYTKSFSDFHYCGYITRFEADKTYYEFDLSKVRFYVTSDKTVDPNKIYYTKSDDGKYYECSSLTAFESGITYYEYDDGFYVTSDTKVDTSKDYYTPKYTYSQCSDLTAFESGVTYYEYNEYDDESDLPLTLKGLDDGRYYTGEDYVKSGDIVYCESAVDKYGPIGTTYKNEDITLREHLAIRAVIALKELVSPKRTIEIKAVDMHLINPDIRPIQIGEYVRVRSKPHNLDSYFLCTNIDLDLNNPENSEYTLGTTFDTLTGQQNKRIKELNATINSVYESAESASKDAKTTAQQARNQVGMAYSEARKAAVNAIDAKNAADQATAKTTLVESKITEIEGNTNDAVASAEQALQKATASATAAGEASAIAEQIQNEISDVKGDAESLKDAISSQIETKTTTMTANLATKTQLTETKTELTSAISQSAADVKTEVEQTYAKKTELTNVKSSLKTSIDQNANAITSTAQEVETVKVDVSTAQSSADKAKTLANAAQSIANAAGSSATEANEAAQVAKEIADAAQADVSNLQSAVVTKFSKIEQATDSISSTVSETVDTVSGHAEQISTLKQNAEGFTARLDKLKIGARNLLVGTGNSVTHTGTGSTNECTFLYKTSDYYKSIPSLSGVELTISFEFETTATSGTFSIQLHGTPWTAFIHQFDVSISRYTWNDLQNETWNDLQNETWNDLAPLERHGSCKNTITCDDGFDTGNYTGIRIRTDNLTGTITIKKVMLEIGNQASSWQEAPEDVGDKIDQASKNATNYLNFSETGLVVGNMTASKLGKNVLIDDDSVDIRNGTAVLASFGAEQVLFNKKVTFKADGITLDNGDAFCDLGKNNILWSHNTGYWMRADQSINLTSNITRQLSGAVFAWCYFENGVPQNSKWKYFFVPKSHVVNNGGDGVYMSDPYLGLMKYLYVSNSIVTGCAENGLSGTLNGIAYANAKYVLRYIIGV